MELTSSYKQTEVGVIPADWEVKPLEKVIALKHGYAFSSENFSKSGPIVLTPGNFSLEGGLYFEERNTTRYSASYSPKTTLNRGDLLIVMTDLTPNCNLLGKPAFVETDEVVLHNQRIGKVVLKDKSVHLPMLFYFLLSRTYLDHIREQAVGSTVRHTSSRSIYSAKLFWPPLPEQRAIAEALNDVDALLGGLDRLIAKKRDIKQAAMQKLLTGQTRLPGFFGEWIIKRIGEVAPLQRGFDLPNSLVRRGPYPVVYSNGILNHHAAFQVKGPGVVTGRSGTIGKVSFIEQDYWPHNTSLWVTNFRGNDPKFIFYLLTSIGLNRFATGSGVPTLNRNDVHEFSVNIPAAADEQAAIATVLSDMDAEIAVLHSRRNKTLNLKQGMMQALLTGSIRLVQAEPT